MATQEWVEPRSARGAYARELPERRGENTSPRRLAKALGWFSIGLGVTEIVAPGILARLIGTRKRPNTMRLMGVREVAAGIGILAARRPGPWLWARVAGDAVDLASLASAVGSSRARTRLGATIGAVAGVTALDAICARQLQPTSKGTHFTASMIINKSPEECYRYWHDVTKLPTFIDHLKSVQVTGDRRTHWVSQGPAGEDLEWDAEITEDVPNQVIAWRSVEGSQFPNWGRVRFESAPAGRGTIVRLLMNYDAPWQSSLPLLSGILGSDPAMRVRRDLMRFKQRMETGEVATIEGQPAGRRSGATWMDRVVMV